LNDVQEKWLGTLTSVPNKGKKVPRHAPACLIGCAAYGFSLLISISHKFVINLEIHSKSSMHL